jgi:hypothetical protein
MIGAMVLLPRPSASGRRGKGFFRRKRISRSDDAESSSLDARDRIARQHRLPVVELEALAELERPQLAVILDAMAFDHLRLRLIRLGHPIKRVEDEEGVVARDIGSGENGIEHAEIGLRHEFEHIRALRPGKIGRGERRDRAHGAERLEESAAFHERSRLVRHPT